MDAGGAENWAAGVRPLSRWRVVSIFDGSDNPSVPSRKEIP